MRRLVRRSVLTALLLSGWAQASPNDFEIYQLGNPTSGAVGFSPVANGNFRAFVRELAAGFTSVTLTPPNTLGSDGFAYNAELSVVDFRPNSQFIMPTEVKPYSGPTLMPSLHVRKGLPWSLEVGFRLAYLDRSSVGVATGEVRCSLTEGYTALPTVTVRAFVTRPFNIPDLSLLAGGLDVTVGKRFAIGGMITLTPYVGWTPTFAAASSDTVDFNRSQTAAQAQSGPAAPFTNSAVYDQVTVGSNIFNRFYGGLLFQGGVFQLGAEASYAAVGSFSETPTGTTTAVSRSLPGVFAFNTTIGINF
jgi:hypothetical protein